MADCGPAGLREYMAAEQERIDRALREYLTVDPSSESAVSRAMHYSVFAGGKRFRPILALAAGRALEAPEEQLLPAAAALEMVHTYSLIHDDLPALDNDDLRRGQPTCHKVFGEAVAILAGDGLLTRAFQVLADHPEGREFDARKVEALRVLSRACGPEGMISGQAEDLAWEGHEHITEETVQRIHQGKTAALITAALRIGALMAGGSREALHGLEIYGENLGLVFQITDDILDIEETSEELGKTAGKDRAQKKATYPAILGLEESRRRVERYLSLALAALAPWGDKGRRLQQLAEFVATRRK